LNKIKKRLFFRVDGDVGQSSGLGHLNRVLKIYKYLKKNNFKYIDFYFITKKHSLGHKLITQYTNEAIIDPKVINKQNFFMSSDKVIIDTLGIDKSFRKLINNSNVKEVVSFDEVNTKINKKLIIINGIYFTKKKIINKNNKNLRIYQGANYLLLDKVFKLKKLPKSYNNILITSGGTDSKNFLYNLTNFCFKKLPKNFRFIIIIGKGVTKNNNIFKMQSSRISLIISPNNIKKYLDNSIATICSGGIVMHESISSGRTTFAIKTYDNQKYAIKYFEKKKLIFNCGNIYKIKKDMICNKIIKIKNNKKKIVKVFNKNSSYIDGKGFERIISILKTYINN
jgi:spore coat polysaccharide biosynthesis predicted glycosyltransferase SpsG